MNCVLATLLSVWGMPGDLSSPRPCARALVALVDVSGSMGIDDKGQTRLSRAVSLIRDLARDNPPAPGRPIILVTFNNQALVHEHTELPTLEKQLESLRPGGGTSISSGLRAACKVAERHVEAARLELLLVTDMEDSERESIAMEQDRLNRLFQKRGSEGRADGDSLVFVRTWAKNDASAQRLGEDLAGPIVKNGAGKTVDLGKAEPRRLPLRASVRCAGTRWDEPRKSMIVTLEAETSLGNVGPVPGGVTLLAPAGQSLSIPAGSGACKGEIKLPVVGNSPVRIRLELVVNRFQHTSDGLVIVDSPGPLEIEAPLPSAPLGISFSGKTVKAEWARLSGDIVGANIEVAWQVEGPVPEPFGVLVEATQGSHITSKDTFLVDSPNGKAVIKAKGTIPADTEKPWSFTITPDPRAKFPLPPSDITVAVKGPPAVSVKAVLAAPGRSTPKDGYSWFLAKGASWELKPAIEKAELDPSATDGLLLQLSASPSTATVPADSLSPAGESAKIGIEFPDTGYFSPSAIALEASFQPVPETTSVIPEPIRLAATRESKALLMVAIFLGGVICLLLAIGVYKAFSTRTGRQARVLPGC